MTAIILVWNPEHWNGWTYPAVVAEAAETGLFLASWSVGRHQDIPSGADAWLLLQGRHGRGLLGHGVVVSEHPLPEPQPQGAAPEGAPENYAPGPLSPASVPPLYVRVAFEALLPAGDHIDMKILQEAVPGVAWDTIHGSGMTLDPPEEGRIRQVWSDFGPQPGPDATQPVPGTLPGYALSRVDVNRYERSPDAQRACIAHHGTNCAACGFSYEIAYGELGKDFIQVHHIVPPAQLGSGYELDPVADLVPLCANCHAMAHRGAKTARTVAELRRIMGAAGFLSGHALSPEELAAQRDARRILEQH